MAPVYRITSPVVKWSKITVSSRAVYADLALRVYKAQPHACAIVEYWSVWQDSNLRPRASEARTLNQTELHTDIGAPTECRSPVLRLTTGYSTVEL